eukprot:1882342-Pleurochrysis_carterae.AAC.3
MGTGNVLKAVAFGAAVSRQKAWQIRPVISAWTIIVLAYLSVGSHPAMFQLIISRERPAEETSHCDAAFIAAKIKCPADTADYMAGWSRECCNHLHCCPCSSRALCPSPATPRRAPAPARP